MNNRIELIERLDASGPLRFGCPSSEENDWIEIAPEVMLANVPKLSTALDSAAANEQSKQKTSVVRVNRQGNFNCEAPAPENWWFLPAVVSLRDAALAQCEAALRLAQGRRLVGVLPQPAGAGLKALSGGPGRWRTLRPESAQFEAVIAELHAPLEVPDDVALDLDPDDPMHCFVRRWRRSLLATCRPASIELLLSLGTGYAELRVDGAMSGPFARIDPAARPYIDQETRRLTLHTTQPQDLTAALAALGRTHAALLARTVEAAWGGSPPSTVLCLDLFETEHKLQARTVLQIDTAGWGFGLAEIAIDGNPEQGIRSETRITPTD